MNEEKIYTSTYSNFRGVDMTNDPSNIYRLRMAEGLNMAPDEAGTPWKRTGWEVAVTNEDLRTAFNSAMGGSYSITINPIRTYHFTLKGVDHIAYIADVKAIGSNVQVNGGVFMVSEEGITFLKVGQNALSISPHRCYFFEAKGEAGFYMYGNKASNPQSLEQYNPVYAYKATSTGFETVSVSAYVPTILIARDPVNGGGTLYESPNMLTGWRTVLFSGTEGTKQYSLPSQAKTNIANPIKVEVMNGEGQWIAPSGTYSLNTQGTTVTFTVAPGPSPIDGEDNVRITYYTTGFSTSITSGTIYPYATRQAVVSGEQRTKEKIVTRRHTPNVKATSATYIERGTVNGTEAYKFRIAYSTTTTYTDTVEYGQESDWESYPVSNSGKASCTAKLATLDGLEVQGKIDGTWTTLTEGTGYTKSYQSYSGDITITLPSNTTVDYSVGAQTEETGNWIDNLESSRSSQDYVVRADIIWIPVSYGTQSQAQTRALAYAKQWDGTSGMNDPGEGGIVKIGGTSVPSAWQAKYVYYTYETVYTYEQTQSKTISTTYSYPLKVSTSTTSVVEVSNPNAGVNAFSECRRATLFGSGLLNSVFMSACNVDGFASRVWYSGVGDPTYFPDTNYIEVGSNDTEVMGMLRVGEYLGIVKQGKNMDNSVYLAYPTSFEDNTTYAIKQSINGVGAVSNGAFNVLGDDALFLSSEGVMAITPNDEDRQLKNRSFYINRPLLAEPDLDKAVSFVHDGMYFLALPNGHCYVLDGNQKISWENERTNLQFEAYVWDNVPAMCFARMNGQLWFVDKQGNLCKFKEPAHSTAYHDDYNETNTKTVVSDAQLEFTFDESVYDSETDELKTFRYEDGNWYTGNRYNVELEPYYTLPGVDITIKDHEKAYKMLEHRWLGTQVFSVNVTAISPLIEYQVQIGDGLTWQAIDPDEWGVGVTINISQVVRTGRHAEMVSSKTEAPPVDLADYGITLYDEPSGTLTVKRGVPIKARFATIADDDGAIQYFKTMKKKGAVVSLLPKLETGAKVLVRADEKDEKQLMIAGGLKGTLPSDVFVKKKVKKYKRLQFIVENNSYDETFGVDQITKQYVVRGYSKNRRT